MTDEMRLPRYDELPLIDKLNMRHAWDVLDRDLGSVALRRPEHLRAAAQLVTEGEVVALDLSLREIDPPLFGRPPLRHRVLPSNRNINEDVLDDFNPQSSSQWDGLRHVRAREFGFFGGVTELDENDKDTLSIEHWARTGITGRGVLLDVAGWKASQGSPLDPMAGDEITAAELKATAQAQGVEFREGDILCIRTGWIEAYRALDAEGRGKPEIAERFTGLRGDEASARFVWDHRFSAVCADNPAVECAPGDPAVGSLHRRLLPLLGTALAELLDFDQLAQRCRELGRWEFLFVAAPLGIPGGVSSPANALAIL